MKVCFILVAGLDQALLAHTPGLKTLVSPPHRTTFRPPLPAVTSTVQATLTTGSAPSAHGIIANGLFTHNRPDLHPHLDLSSFPDFRQNISFWEQADSLLQRPRFWEPHRAAGKKIAMLFWQNSMPGTGAPSADIILTPQPTHTPDGITLTACWSHPADLYASLTAKLGPFPLHHYWGPMAGLPSSQWIINAAMETWTTQNLDLQLVYIPHMDYNLQRQGPGTSGTGVPPVVLQDLLALDAALAPLVALVRSTGGTPIICGDYAITPVSRCIMPNRIFREAGLLQTTPDAAGKLLIDYDRSAAVAMVDHQIAHIYTQVAATPTGASAPLLAMLRRTPGIAQVAATPEEKRSLGLDSPRSGDIIAIAEHDTWFAHDWWLDDSEKPAWQFSVDIHRKPGYDPRELFADPVKRIILQDTGVVKGSHGAV